MSLIRKSVFRATALRRLRGLSRLLHSANEFTPTPQYPAIIDVSESAQAIRDREAAYDKYRALKTIEEKLFVVNLPRYYGWKVVPLKEAEIPYDFLPFVQHVTRSQVFSLDKDNFRKLRRVDGEEVKSVAEKIRDEVQQALIFELRGRKANDQIELKHPTKGELNNILTTYIVEHLNRIILSHTAQDHPHLLESVVDHVPRVEAFWPVGDFPPTEEVLEERRLKKLKGDQLSERIEQMFQYYGSPLLQVRIKAPLPNLDVGSLGNEVGDPSSVPKYDHDPILVYGFEMKRCHGTNLPGFWPGSAHEFGLLSYHPIGHLLDRPPHYGPEDVTSAQHAQAILSSFAWTLGQACYQGFSPYQEITYPFNAQTVLTDGKKFEFYLYQMNTLLTYAENIHENSRVNICFTTPSQPLYQELDGNTFTGWNDETLCNLISMYLNKPQVTDGLDLKPYVGKDEVYLKDIQEDERRTWLHNQFRHMYSNRPRHRLPYEIYDWERIYKIKFQTRPLEARSRPFERDENPLEDRKYYEHMPPYIPKRMRPKNKHWTNWRRKFARKYYPEL